MPSGKDVLEQAFPCQAALGGFLQKPRRRRDPDNLQAGGQAPSWGFQGDGGRDRLAFSPETGVRLAGWVRHMVAPLPPIQDGTGHNMASWLEPDPTES